MAPQKKFKKEKETNSAPNGCGCEEMVPLHDTASFVYRLVFDVRFVGILHVYCNFYKSVLNLFSSAFKGQGGYPCLC